MERQEYVPNTKYLPIKKAVELSIINETYKSGEKLPKISILAEQFNVGISTIKKVIKELVEEDVLFTKAGVGGYVKPFAKEKLKSKNKVEYKKMDSDVINEAYKYGLSKKEVADLIKEKSFTHGEDKK